MLDHANLMAELELVTRQGAVDGKVLDIEKYSVSFQRPNRIRFSSKNPNGPRLVSDGMKMVIRTSSSEKPEISLAPANIETLVSSGDNNALSTFKSLGGMFLEILVDGAGEYKNGAKVKRAGEFTYFIEMKYKAKTISIYISQNFEIKSLIIPLNEVSKESKDTFLEVVFSTISHPDIIPEKTFQID
jgi:outer membrane lipoprotein-sorting protein